MDSRPASDGGQVRQYAGGGAVEPCKTPCDLLPSGGG